MSSTYENVVEVRNLCKYFPIRAGLFGRVKAFIPGYVEPGEDWE